MILPDQLNFQPNEKNTFNLFYYQSFDKFRYSTLSDYEYSNRGGSASWEKHISPALTSKAYRHHLLLQLCQYRSE